METCRRPIPLRDRQAAATMMEPLPSLPSDTLRPFASYSMTCADAAVAAETVPPE